MLGKQAFSLGAEVRSAAYAGLASEMRTNPV